MRISGGGSDVYPVPPPESASLTLATFDLPSRGRLGAVDLLDLGSTEPRGDQLAANPRLGDKRPTKNKLIPAAGTDPIIMGVRVSCEGRQPVTAIDGARMWRLRLLPVREAPHPVTSRDGVRTTVRWSREALATSPPALRPAVRVTHHKVCRDLSRPTGERKRRAIRRHGGRSAERP